MPQGVWGIGLDDACGLQVARHHALDGADMHGRIRSTGARKQQGHGWALSQTATPMLVSWRCIS